jgi:hypothetical protein
MVFNLGATAVLKEQQETSAQLTSVKGIENLEDQFYGAVDLFGISITDSQSFGSGV